MCGAPPARASAVLEIDLGGPSALDVDTEIAFDAVPARVRRRVPRRRGALVAAMAFGSLALVVHALVDDPGRPAVLPATVRTTEATSVADRVATSTPTDGPSFGEPTGLRLVVVDAPDLASIDLDTGRVVALDADLLARSAGAPAVATSMGLAYVDRVGGVSVLPPDASTSRTVLDPVDGVRATAVLGDGPGGRLWVVLGASSGAGQVSLVGPDGEVEPVGSVPAGATVRADGAGGVVVGAAGGVYRLVPGSPARRITGGTLLDSGWGRVLSLECDESLACAWQVLDLADGSHWRVAVPVHDPGLVTLTPDGRRLLRAVPVTGGAAASLELVDADGDVRPLDASRLTCADASCRPSVVWSPDGRWLVAATPGGDLWGWRDGLEGQVRARLATGSPVPTVATLVALTTASAAPA